MGQYGHSGQCPLLGRPLHHQLRTPFHQHDILPATIDLPQLLAHANAELEKIEGLRVFGTTKDKAAVVSFVLDGVHAHDVGTILDREGIAVRTGHHCAQPVMDHFGVPATTRASFGLYTTLDEVDALAQALEGVKEIFG